MNGTHTVEQFPGFCLVRDPHGDEVCSVPDGVDAARSLAAKLDAYAALVDAAALALSTLHNLTSEQFARGDDRHARAALESALRIAPTAPARFRA